MSFFSFKNIRISCVSAAVPTKVVRVSDFVTEFGEEVVEKFSKGTGIKEFRVTSEYQTASDLCYAAAENIFKAKKVSRDEIGALVFCSLAPDYRRPSTSCVLHKRLGLSKDCATFDIGLGCSAFIYGLQVVCSMMQCSNISKALLLCGETLSKVTNASDKTVAMLFGDGGSAVLLEKSDNPYDIQGLLKTDGDGYRAIIIPAGGFRYMHAANKEIVCSDGNTRSLYNTIMNGDDVFGFTISAVPDTIKDFCNKTNTAICDYDCMAFHQANIFISKMLCKILHIEKQKMAICLDRYGNTSAPAIPMAICDKFGDNSENKEYSFLMCGFGVGLSWGVSSAKINVQDILPIIETDNVYSEGVIQSPNFNFE